MKTSKADFKKFKDEVEKWIGKFGLTNWDVAIIHGDPEDSDKASADIAWISFGDYGTQVATIALNEQYTGMKLADRGVERAAFHEVCHLLLYNLCVCVEKRFAVSKEDYEKEVHSLITVLENTLWKSRS